MLVCKVWKWMGFILHTPSLFATLSIWRRDDEAETQAPEETAADLSPEDLAGEVDASEEIEEEVVLDDEVVEETPVDEE